jgi:N-acetyl-gamma-glutamyl-phosphate reductase
MAPRIYIDGQHGTTGLRIRELLASRRDVEVLEIAEDARRDEAARRGLLERADLAVLCLPDEAALQVAGWLAGSSVKLVDASTAHRTSDGWVYGLPELAPGQRAAIRTATRLSNPGCYPTGVALLLRPLVDAGMLPATTPIAVHALSGYTGGGKPMIERWESPAHGLPGLPFEAPYALERRHKHVPEMLMYSRLTHAPQFVPAVGPFRTGMRIEIPLHAQLLGGTRPAALHAALAARYADERFVRVQPLLETGVADELALDPRACNDTNRIELTVAPNSDGHVLLVAVLDNLGKGAAGAAVQNLNLMLGLPEDAGLSVPNP